MVRARYWWFFICRASSPLESEQVASPVGHCRRTVSTNPIPKRMVRALNYGREFLGDRRTLPVRMVGWQSPITIHEMGLIACDSSWLSQGREADR